MKISIPTLIAVGDNCLDAYLDKDFLTVGGNALNVAVQWKRHGCNARYFGALGMDEEAEIMLDTIAQTGLARDDVEIRKGQSAVTLLSDRQGERHFLLESLGVGQDYLPDLHRYQAMRSADWVHLGTNASQTLVRDLVADKVPFSVDVSTRHRDLSLENVPLVFASGPDDPSVPVEPLVAWFRQQGAQKVVVTCGRRGAFYHDGDTLFFAGSIPVSVVDTCGAGDSFIAKFLSAHFFDGCSAQDALDQAALNASETCRHPGGFPQPVQPLPLWLLQKYDSFFDTTKKV